MNPQTSDYYINYKPDPADEFAGSEYICMNIGQILFQAEKYTRKAGEGIRGFAATRWKVHPAKGIEEHIEAMDAFYEELKHGNLAAIDKTVKSREVTVVLKNNKLALPVYNHVIKEFGFKEMLSKLNIPLASLEFQFFRMNTPYADFGFEIVDAEKTKKESWNPKNGNIGVVSHEDISEPLSRLIVATMASDYVLPEKVEEILQRIYQFE